MDAKVVVEWVSSQAHLNIAHSSLIADYKSLMSQFPKVQTNYCYREANQCASRLTTYGAKLEQDLIIYDSLIRRSICCCFMIFQACVLRGLCLTLVRIKYSQNSTLIRHAAFSIHSFEDQSRSYKL